MKTKAAILQEINRPLPIEALNIPEIKPGQVLVKVAYSGICHTQLNEIQGLKGEDKFLPHTLGHEGSGLVELVGEGVQKVKPGDHVVLTWIKGSGIDVPSSSYTRADGSKVNSGAIATFLTRALVAENRVVKIPETFSLQDASLLGCAVPTGLGIVMNTAKVVPGCTVAVFGIGGIGLFAMIGAKIQGAGKIIAIDIMEQKLRKALELGATEIINAQSADVLSEIMKMTNGKGVDFAIECAGSTMAMEIAFRAVRDNGGTCVIAGNVPYGERMGINPFDLIKGKKIIGTWGGETNPDQDIKRYIQLCQEGKLNLDFLTASLYSLEEINSAIEDLRQGKVHRPIIKMSHV